MESSHLAIFSTYGKFITKFNVLRCICLTIFDMGFFLTISYGGGGGHEGHNFVVIGSMIMKFATGVKLDVFYTVATKIVTSLLLCRYDVITCILADA